jgi:hypothetical protein
MSFERYLRLLLCAFLAVLLSGLAVAIVVGLSRA